jgi:hypothetical protein
MTVKTKYLQCLRIKIFIMIVFLLIYAYFIVKYIQLDLQVLQLIQSSPQYHVNIGVSLKTVVL